MWKQSLANRSFSFLLFFRLLLAVMHYNENSERVQATNRDGELQYSINYPKAKQGGYTVKKVLNDCTYGKVFYSFLFFLFFVVVLPSSVYVKIFWNRKDTWVQNVIQKVFSSSVPLFYAIGSFSSPGYVDQLMMEVQTLVDDEDATTVNVVDAPAPLCSNYDRPNKQTAITEHFTRFPRSKTRAV